MAIKTHEFVAPKNNPTFQFCAICDQNKWNAIHYQKSKKEKQVPRKRALRSVRG